MLTSDGMKQALANAAWVGRVHGATAAHEADEAPKPGATHFDERFVDAVGPGEAMRLFLAGINDLPTKEQFRRMLEAYDRAAREAWDAECETMQ